jgi:hypothetical protein
VLVGKKKGKDEGYSVNLPLRLRYPLSLGLSTVACGLFGTEAQRSPVSRIPSPAPREIAQVEEARCEDGSPRHYLKGQTHIHSSNSYDGQARPERVVQFYESRGYDFIVFTDHNVVTWRPSNSAMMVFGGVEISQNARACGRPSREKGWCLAHVNALFVDNYRGHIGVSARQPSRNRMELYQRALEITRDLGGVAQLNHPNFNRTADADVIAGLADQGLPLFEIHNHVVDDRPTPAPSLEAMWDSALSAGHRLYGVASDDAHDFDAPRGQRRRRWNGNFSFVMVKACRERTSVRDAMLAGRFYSSTGVILDEAQARGGALRVRVNDAGTGDYVIDFIGSGGDSLGRVEGREASYAIDRLPRGGYVRAVVYGPHGIRAWVQPVWRD